MTHDDPESRPGAWATADAHALRWRGLTLALLTIVYFFSFMDRYILTILLEMIKKDLHLSDTQLGLLQGIAFALLYATLGIPVASLADKHNRRNIISVSLAIWSAMTAACGLAQNFAQLMLFRVGVGIGEAGSSPPSHSIIADLYPPDKRSGAMAIFATGVVLGGGFGTMIGGTVAAAYGWRWALAVIGLPGLVLALAVRLFVVEPRRGLSEPDTAHHADHPTIREGAAAMFANPVVRHLVAALTITSMVGYALASFLPSFTQRSLGLSMLTVALQIAPVIAVVGTIAGILGGRIADAAGRRYGASAQPWVVAGAKAIAFPCSIGVYLSGNVASALTLLVAAYFFASSYLGPSFALIQGHAPLRMRAVWASITLLCTNLIGLGLGPSLVGILSDALHPRFGVESLRYAMLIVELATPWAIFHYWRAGVLMRRREGAVAA